MWIKICGITDIISALHCEMEGVSAVGLVFVPWSPRYISWGLLNKIAPHLKKLKILKIGVFINPTLEELKEIMNILPLDGIQFHGDEEVGFLEKFKEFFLIKAINVDKEENLERSIEKFSNLSYILLDKSKNSNLNFEEFLIRVKKYVDKKTILAGGINEENLERVLVLDPFGIDLSSSVEIEKGKKDLLKISNFMRKVREYERNRFEKVSR